MSLQGSPISAEELGVRRHARPQIELGSPQRHGKRRRSKCGALAPVALVAILDVGEQRRGHARLIGAARRKHDQPSAQFRPGHQRIGKIGVEQEIGGAGRPQPPGLAGIAWYEQQFAVGERARTPDETIRRLGRLAVLIEPDQRDIETVAREGKIVGVAAERAGRVFRAQHKADIVIGAVFVQRIFAARIERDDLAIAVRVALAAVAFDPCDFGVARLLERFAGQSRRRLDQFRRHVADRHDDLGFKAGALPLVGLRRRQHRRHVEILPGRRQVLDAVEHAMMVGRHQAMPADDTGRASRQPDRRQPDMVEPRRIGSKAVGLPDFLRRKIVERPQPFIRMHGRTGGAKATAGRWPANFGFIPPPSSSDNI